MLRSLISGLLVIVSVPCVLRVGARVCTGNVLLYAVHGHQPLVLLLGRRQARDLPLQVMKHSERLYHYYRREGVTGDRCYISYLANTRPHALLSYLVYLVRMIYLTPPEPQSRFGDKPFKSQVVCPQNGTAVLKAGK